VPALPVTPSAVPAAASAASASPCPRPRFGHLLEARLAPRGEAPPAAAPPPLAIALRSVEAAQARLDAVLAAARRGQAFSAGQLLALQADAHRFTQTLDVAGKLVEQGVQSVKQAIQTQV
jgi:hypothetical protein